MGTTLTLEFSLHLEMKEAWEEGSHQGSDGLATLVCVWGALLGKLPKSQGTLVMRKPFAEGQGENSVDTSRSRLKVMSTSWLMAGSGHL